MTATPGRLLESLKATTKCVLRGHLYSTTVGIEWECDRCGTTTFDPQKYQRLQYDD